MKTRSPGFMRRMFWTAWGLVTPSQVVFCSRAKVSMEYVPGSVLARKKLISIFLLKPERGGVTEAGARRGRRKTTETNDGRAFIMECSSAQFVLRGRAA